MNLRQFNSTGIEIFRQFLAEARKNPDTKVPMELLTERALTTEVMPRIPVQPRHFSGKHDAAHYLRELLDPLDADAVAKDAGLWTWLSLYHFEDVCPLVKGQRSVKNDYTYIFEPVNVRHFYRHLMFMPWHILRLAPLHNRLFLEGRISVLDKATTEVFKRLFLTRVPCVFEVLDRLYWDPDRGRIRSGMVSPEVRPGDLMHRFPIRIRQLEMTYDLQSLHADQLIELLGEEFQMLAAS